eukprot:TRINITY_DN65132_c0_g1_i1.p1 TRINITY_DN65132_c0_g1~~TRINITY_DN65132_c0_g1_i1.p1  ORF type:complete len:1864 (+),score=684.53 TRINITY_DN65132_c0_g1_i1:764-5593(+)
MPQDAPRSGVGSPLPPDRRRSLAAGVLPDVDGAVPAPPKQSGKRMSLVDRQKLVQASAPLPNGRQPPRPLPSPQAKVVDPDNDDSSPQKLPPLGGPPKAEGAPAAQRRLTERGGEDAEKGENPAQQKRASTIGLTRLSRNGKKGCITTLYFNGQETYVIPPEIPGLDQFVNFWEVEMWVRSEQRMAPMTLLWIEDQSTSIAAFRISLNTNERFEYAENSTLFYIRDNSSNTVCAVGHEDICDGRWHHLSFTVRDAADNLLAMKMDGKPCRLTLRAAEGANNFQGWDQRVCVGGEIAQTSIDGTRKMDKLFLGSIQDLKVWSYDGRTMDAQLRVHWPFELDPADPNSAKDVLGAADGVIHRPDWMPDDFPETCLYFNGTTSHVNVGTLGDFGEHMGFLSVEFWMKSDVTDRSMALMKVTDSAHKHAQLGFELNRNGDFEYQRAAALLSVRDAFGNELVAQQTAHNLCDNQWHQIHWEVHCPSNQMTLKVDCFNVELEYRRQDLPGSFFPLQSWLSLGAHNCRGQLQSHFCGFIKEVKIAAGQVGKDRHSVGHWPLDEGAGASLVMDHTGNGNNGIVYDKQTRRKCATWLRVKQPDVFAHTIDGATVSQQVVDVDYPNNKVELAVVQTVYVAGADGLYDESIVDLTTDQELKLGRKMCCAYGRAWEQPWREMCVVPDSVFRQCGSFTDVFGLTQEAMEAGRQKNQRASRIYTLRIGDGQLTVFDLLPFCRRTRSQWDPKKCEWVAPVVMMTQEDKQTIILNRKVAATEKTLAAVGKTPTLFRRARINFDSIPWSEAVCSELLQSALFATTASTGLYWVHMLRSAPSADEEGSTQWMRVALDKATGRQAAIVVQKSMRRCLAKKRLAAAAAAKELELKRRAHKVQMRKDYPERVWVRDRRVVLLVSALPLDDPRVAGVPGAVTLRRADALAKGFALQGWEVWTLAADPTEDPQSPVQATSQASLRSKGSFSPGRKPAEHRGAATSANIRRALADLEAAAQEGAAVLIHLMGFVANQKYHRWPTRKEIHDSVSADEEDWRRAITAEEVAAWAHLKQFCASDKEDAAEAEETRKKEEREDKKLQRKLEQERKKSEAGGWVTSTKVDHAQKQAELAEAAEARKRERERRKAKRDEKWTCDPVELPPMQDLPPEQPPREDVVRFLLCRDTPLECSEHNTVSIEEVVRAFCVCELGNHAVVTVEGHAAPYGGSPDYALLASASGERRTWEGPHCGDFLSVYLAKALTGSGTGGISSLLKSDARAAKEAEMVGRWEDAVQSALEAGRPRPPNPLSKRGVSSDLLYEYIGGGLVKRGLRPLPADPCEPFFFGDMIIADQKMESLAHIPTRRREKGRAAAGELRLQLDETVPRETPEGSVPLGETILERLQALEPGIERRPDERCQHVLLAYKGDLTAATPPAVGEDEWGKYLSRLLDWDRAQFDYRLTLSPEYNRGSFLCIVTPRPDAPPGGKTLADADLSCSNRVLGRLTEDTTFSPTGTRPKGSKLPGPPAFPLVAYRRELLYRIHHTRGTLARLEKMYMQGRLTPLFADLAGVTIANFRWYCEEEFDALDKSFRAMQEAKRKEIERRKSELSAPDRRMREIEKQRKSLREQINASG